MIDRYSIRVAPAGGRQEMEMLLHESNETPKENVPALKKMRARVDIVGDFGAVKPVRHLGNSLVLMGLRFPIILPCQAYPKTKHYYRECIRSVMAGNPSVSGEGTRSRSGKG